MIKGEIKHRSMAVENKHHTHTQSLKGQRHQQVLIYDQLYCPYGLNFCETDHRSVTEGKPLTNTGGKAQGHCRNILDNSHKKNQSRTRPGHISLQNKKKEKGTAFCINYTDVITIIVIIFSQPSQLSLVKSAKNKVKLSVIYGDWNEMTDTVVFK